MMIFPVRWSWKRKSLMPIIEAKAESPLKEAVLIMVHEAVEMIDMASEYKGVPCSVYSLPVNDISVTVSFSLIFPSEKELTSFMEDIRKSK